MGTASGQLKDLKRQASAASGISLEEGLEQGQRVQAGFESNLATLGMLGQPGTYSSPTTGAPGVGPGGITSAYPAGGGLLGGAGGTQVGTTGAGITAGSLFQDKPISKAAEQAAEGGGGKGLYAATGGKVKGVLDPTKFSQAVSQMPVAQIISRQVAEAQGLTDPSSPFRQSLEQSIKNPIVEAGASALRESHRMIQNNMAKGGTARRAAMADAQNMMAIEQTNRQVGQQMWQANLQFESWIRDYQTSTVNSAMAFTNGLGVNNYVNAMNAAGEFLVNSAIPTSINMKKDAVQAASQVKHQSLGKMILGAAMVVGGAALSYYTGGVGGVGLMSAGTGMLGGGDMGESMGQAGGGILGGLGGGRTPPSVPGIPGTPGTLASARAQGAQAKQFFSNFQMPQMPGTPGSR